MHSPDSQPSPAVRDPLQPLANASVAVAGAALIGLVAVQGWQVIARYLLNSSPSWTEPVTLLLLSAAMSFGAAAGVHSGAHFSFTLLAQASSPPLRRGMAVAQHLVVIAIGAALAGWSTLLLLDGLDVDMAGAPLPQSASYAPLAIGGALIALFGAQRLLRELVGTEGSR